jgi:hypothetical protein
MLELDALTQLGAPVWRAFSRPRRPARPGPRQLRVAGRGRRVPGRPAAWAEHAVNPRPPARFRRAPRDTDPHRRRRRSAIGHHDARPRGHCRGRTARDRTRQLPPAATTASPAANTAAWASRTPSPPPCARSSPADGLIGGDLAQRADNAAAGASSTGQTQPDAAPVTPTIEDLIGAPTRSGSASGSLGWLQRRAAWSGPLGPGGRAVRLCHRGSGRGSLGAVAALGPNLLSILNDLIKAVIQTAPALQAAQ